MDLITGLKTEVFRPIATIIVPGTVALVPYVLVAKSYNPAMGPFVDKYTEIAALLGLVMVIAAGLIIESLGSRIELGWDKILEKKHKHGEEWREYLTLKLGDEIVGQRYLQTIITRMKFELSFCVALVIFIIGLNWLNALECYWTWCSMVVLTFSVLVLAAYVLFESYCSAKVACNTRQDILKGYKAAGGTP